MSGEYLKKIIVDYVNSKQGCKAMELVEIICMVDVQDSTMDLSDAIKELVNEGKLVEVEYCLESMDYRVKSFLLPAGTTINKHNG
jgi:hypothetical protein